MNILQKLKVRAKAVLRFVGTAVEELFDRVKERIKTWYARYKYFVEKENYIEITKDSQSDYVVNQQDKLLADECQAYIDKALPSGLTEALEPLSDSDRIEFVRGFVQDLSEVMGVDIHEVRFFSPSCPEEASCLGMYDPEEKSIVLNALFIFNLEEPKATEYMTRTILHELKHARQYAAIEGENDFGYDKDVLDTWRYNFAYYIRSEECDEAYRKQPVEVDADGWSSLINLHAESF